MSKKKIKIIIFCVYLISLFIFQLIAANNIDSFLETVEGFNPIAVLVPSVVAGIQHFILVSGIAIIIKFIKRIDREYKTLFYIFPIITFVFSLPMHLVALYVYNLFE